MTEGVIETAVQDGINNAAFYNRLADVQLPAEPSLVPLIVTIATITAAFIALTYLWHRRHHSSLPTGTTAAAQALQRLQTIEQTWSNGKIDERETAYQLSTLLRLGLGLQQLPNQCPPSITENKGEWQQTITLFNQLRYKPQATLQITDSTFEQLRQWITASHHNINGQYDV